MAKPKKIDAKLTKKAQYERFKETARELGVDNSKSAEEFERSFKKIVEPKHRPHTGHDGK